MKHTSKFFPKIMHKGRARIEQAFGKLKPFKRVVLRYKETPKSFASMSHTLALCFILLKSVHTLSGKQAEVIY